MKNNLLENDKLIIYIELANEKSRIKNSTVAIEELEMLLVVANEDIYMSEVALLKLTDHINTLEYMILLYNDSIVSHETI